MPIAPWVRSQVAGSFAQLAGPASAGKMALAGFLAWAGGADVGGLSLPGLGSLLLRVDVPTCHLLASDRAGVGNLRLDGTTGRDLSAPSSERTEFRTKQVLSFSGDPSAH